MVHHDPLRTRVDEEVKADSGRHADSGARFDR
jgi:hypothetical protein